MDTIHPKLHRDMEVLARRWGRGRRYSLRAVGREMGISYSTVRTRELGASRWIRFVLEKQGYDVVPREGLTEGGTMALNVHNPGATNSPLLRNVAEEAKPEKHISEKMYP